jgi:Family of unknown function (DUF6064)
MPEWWSYRPSDFLMFAPRVYWRLFELVNEAAWPLQPLLLAAGLAGAWALARGSHWPALAGGLAAAWGLVAVLFVQQRYVPINWAAGFALPAIGLLVLLLPALGWQARGGARPGPWARRVALALALWALLLHPLLAPLAGRPWAQAELPGLAPDPTALFTLALLLALPRPAGRGWRALTTLAWAVPLAWCCFSGFTLATMGAPQALVPLLGAAAALLTPRAQPRDVQY